ncbi:S8 family serine peptidase [Kangiella aquimarina]|uniref:S8 family serine peptidase n=1 Tax=Kangiella aquimarina TaxID=261965 RepID=A0ABZ0X7A5_9GAMM|nr:S8 family serine peptidase [Kangiella aquimarina]WQG86492.1 S8 family serine peptidase [Kangiella aquimarina]
MKIKTIASVVVAAVYSAGIAATASAVGGSGYQLEPINISPEAAKSRVESGYETSDISLLEGMGGNVKLSPKVKFKAEDNISGRHNYIIQLKSAPAALYKGDDSGFESTKDLFSNKSLGPRKVDLKSNSKIAAYTSKLKSEQAALISKAGSVGVNLNVKKQHQIAINAVIAEMTQDEAERLSKLSEVAYISRDVRHELLMDIAPERTGVPNAWVDTTIPGNPDGIKGEGMLIGVIDTGINTQHPSFAATGDDGYTVQNPLGSGNFLHDCSAEAFQYLCNDKLIGVWSTPIITDVFSDPEFTETRPAVGEDHQGHGSHTASIAAGNVLYDVPYKIPAIAQTHEGIDTGYVIPQMSGIAPHANIISYQVCYPGNGGDKWVGCPSSAIIPAIEQAILDGVDVINYSISGGYDSHNDPVELSFLSAHESGINVAASAGNAGVYRSVNHVSPWLLSVASSQHGRKFNVQTAAQLQDLSYNGASLPAAYRTDVQGINKAPVSGPMVLAADYGDSLCSIPFPAGTFANGEIVFCERGINALIDKSANVAAGGGAAVVIYNTADSSQDIYPNLPHNIPTVQMDRYDGDVVVAWLNDLDGHYGTIPATEVTRTIDTARQDAISPFSSIGHAYLEEYRESTAPGITAPGSDIYSAYSSDQPFTQYASATDFNSISGTSMSSPHIAGALALIKQARPDWSPSEVMSALQLTANDLVGDQFGRPELANPWFYGSGIAQVDKAIHSGLIMHVPVEHYAIANPHQGGNIGALNTPNMVDSSCYRSCSWVREVTATVDGTWTVSTETDEYSVEIEAFPSTFSLKAGETQRIIINGSWIDSRSVHASPRGLSVFGQVHLTHENPAVPVASMNVEMELDSGTLPEVVEYNVFSAQSSHTIKDLALGEAPNLNVAAYEPVLANIEEVELVERNSGSGSNLFEVAEDLDRVKVTWVTVPEGAKRFVAEVLESGAAINPNEYTKPIGNAGIYVGIDANEDGVIDYDNEAICKSVIDSTDLMDWCNIPNPEAGNYWVVWQEHNYNTRAYLGYEDAVFKHKVATAVVMGDQATYLNVEAPASTNMDNFYDVTLHLDDTDFAEGQKYYTAIEFGTDGNNPDNIGLISTNLVRKKDGINLTASQNGAVVGDVIDYTVSVSANLSGSDRSFNLTSDIPEGLELVDGSVQLVDNRFVNADISQEGNSFTVTGIQTDSRDRKREYIITDSLTDASCRTPVGDGGYVNLYDFGFSPLENAPESNRQPGLQVTLNEIFQDERASSGEAYALFNYQEGNTFNSNSLYIWGNGMVDLHGMAPGFFGAYTNMAFNENYKAPSIANMGVFWYGLAGFGAQGMEFGAPYVDTGVEAEASGISFVRLVNQQNEGTHVLIEWDNLQHVTGTSCTFRGCADWEPNTSSTTSVDAQLILARDYSSATGAYEMVYAYDNLNFGHYIGNGSPFQSNLRVEYSATAGVHGGASPWAGAPIDGYLNQSVVPGFDGYGQLENYLRDDMAICFDYNGPEVTAFEVAFKVKVKPEAIGQSFDVTSMLTMDGVGTKALTASLTSPSNITLFSIDDQSMVEEGTIEGIQVAYMDNNNVSNTISVHGEGVTAVVNGHHNGATFDLIANENFSGMTEVTVTVHDDNQPTDRATTKFMVNVSGVNDAPVVVLESDEITITEGQSASLNASGTYDPDGDSLIFNWSGSGTIENSSAATTSVSGLAAGSYTFTLVVSDGSLQVEKTVDVEVSAAPSTGGTEGGSGGGGSTNWLLLLMLGFFLRKRIRV